MTWTSMRRTAIISLLGSILCGAGCGAVSDPGAEYQASTVAIQQRPLQTLGATASTSMAVYTLNNDAIHNGVVAMASNPDGSLIPLVGSPFATGGTGIAQFVDQQGAVRVFGQFLLAVNPGSNNISVFQISSAGGGSLALVGSPVSSGGVRPVSLTANAGLVYVANNGGTPNITGFRISAQGALTPIPNSMIAFTSGPEQVEFRPGGGVLAVTQFGISHVRTFAVQGDGTLREAPGSPFNTGVSVSGIPIGGNVGFSFTKSGSHLLLSGFNGDTVTLFGVNGTTGALAQPSATFPNHQNFTCWTALSPDGQALYTANILQNNTVSAYTVASSETTLSLVGSTPLSHSGTNNAAELQVTPDGKFVYLVAPEADQIKGFAINPDRSLQELPSSPFSVNSGQVAMGMAVAVTACTPHPINCQVSCGTLSDGCGHTVDCGGCASGQTCTANVCRCPTGTIYCSLTDSCTPPRLCRCQKCGTVCC